MTREEFRAKWSARRAEWEKLGVLLTAAKLCEELMTDFDDVLTSQDEAVVNTNEAAVMTGYSRAQLLRQHKDGRLRGHRKGKNVFFRAGDLPRKPNGGRPAVAKRTGVDGDGGAGARRLADRLGIGRGSNRNLDLR